MLVDMMELALCLVPVLGLLAWRLALDQRAYAAGVVRADIHAGVRRVLQLMGGIENYAAAPSATQLEQIKILQGLLASASVDSRKLTQEDLPALNKMMNEAGVPFITIPRAGGATPSS